MNLSLKHKAARRRAARALRKAIALFRATDIRSAISEALRYRTMTPEWLDRPLGRHGHVVEIQHGRQPKTGDLVSPVKDRGSLDMSDKYVRAAVTLLRSASASVIADAAYFYDSPDNLALIFGVGGFTLAKTPTDLTEAHREGSGWAHHTVVTVAKTWQAACRQAGGDAVYSRTMWAYESDAHMGVVPHGHEMAYLRRDSDKELYPRFITAESSHPKSCAECTRFDCPYTGREDVDSCPDYREE